MTQYIDKSALAAEIERRKEKCDTFYDIALSNNAELAKVAIEEQKKQYNSLLSFIDTLAAKESDDEQSKKWILEYLYDGLRKSNEQFKSQFKDAIAWLEKQGKQTNLPQFTFDDVLALQCAMENVKKVQENKDLYDKLLSLHNKVHDAYTITKR